MDLLELNAALNERVRGKGGAAPPKNESARQDENVAETGVLEAGCEAWQRRKRGLRACWEDWVLIGKALLAGRAHAMALAATNKPAGKAYTQHFSRWLQQHQFDDIDKADRGKAMWMAGNRDEVEAFLSSLPETKRQGLSHPSAVWRAWMCPDRGGRWREQRAETHDADASTEATVQADEVECDVEPDDNTNGAASIRLVHLNAKKAAGLANDCRRFAGDLNTTIVQQVRKTAALWNELADHVEECFRESEGA